MKGIYLITNKISGNKYVGLSINIQRRFSEHRSKKKLKTKIGQAFKKYSVNDFIFEILEFVDNIEDLPKKEIFWIDKLKPEYNMNKGGCGNCGMIVSNETKQILKTSGKLLWESKSESQKESIIKNNLKGPKKGHRVSLETRIKLRNANIGKKQTIETINKRSEKLKVTQIGNNNGNKPVMCFSENVHIKTYESAVMAAKELNIHPSNITKVIKGKQKTAAGFLWKYKGV